MSAPFQYDCIICGSKLKKIRVEGGILFRGTNLRGQMAYANSPATHFICTQCHNVQTFSHFKSVKRKKKPTK